MVYCISEGLKDTITGIVNSHGRERDNLLPILIDINNKYGYISTEAMVEVSNLTDIPIGEIHGVVSFYSFLSIEKRGKFIIRLCRTISCDMADKDKIVRVLEKEIGIKFGETSKDGLFTLEFTNCIGMCDNPPAMLVNDEVYGGLTPEKVVEIIDSYRNRGY
jgi:NADH:ubiquinone oxidoreductase subunit E